MQDLEGSNIKSFLAVDTRVFIKNKIKYFVFNKECLVFRNVKYGNDKLYFFLLNFTTEYKTSALQTWRLHWCFFSV